MKYIINSEKKIVTQKATMEKPIETGNNWNEMAEYEQHVAKLKSFPAEWVTADQDGLEVELDKDFKIYYQCPACGGDGKETCNNPDHGFIDSMPGDVGRLGCPVCGHHPKYKVNGGKNTCPECGGYGHVIPEAFEEYGREYGYDKDPVPVAVAIPAEKKPKYNSLYEDETTYTSDKNFIVRLKALIDRTASEIGFRIPKEFFERLDDAEDYLFATKK